MKIRLNLHRPQTVVIVYAMLALAAWAAVVDKPFMLDDPFLILHNSRIHHWTAQNLRGDFTSAYYPDQSGIYYRPLQFIYLRGIYTAFGASPWAFHALNVFGQVVNGLLVYGLALSLGGSAGAALIAGGLFLIHPIAVHEMLAASQTDLFALTFILGSLGLLLRKTRSSRFLGLVLYGLGLFWKESVLAVPLLLLITQWHSGERKSTAYLRTLAMMLLWIPYWVMRRLAVSQMPSLAQTGLFLYKFFPNVLWHYLRLAIIPWNLETWPPLPAPGPLWIVSAAALWIVIGVILWKGNSVTRWGALWVMLNIASKVPAMMANNVIMDHWIYASLPGLLIPLCMWLFKEHPSPGLAIGRWKAAGMGLLALGWIGLAQWNLAVRGSDEKNFRWSLRFRQQTFVQYRLALFLLEGGRGVEALPILRSLKMSFPQDPNFANAYAIALWRTGNLHGSLSILQDLVARYPNFNVAKDNLDRLRRTLHPLRKA